MNRGKGRETGLFCKKYWESGDHKFDTKRSITWFVADLRNGTNPTSTTTKYLVNFDAKTLLQESHPKISLQSPRHNQYIVYVYQTRDSA